MHFKVFGIALAILVGAWMVSAVGLTIYDRRTKEELTRLIEGELSPSSSMEAMEAFMRRHAVGYHLDDRINFEYAGIRRQSSIDRLVLNRKVGFALRFDPSTARYVGYRVNVYYTFL